MSTTADCNHSFPDPFPQPIEQIGNCRGCGISYQEARAAIELRTAAQTLLDLADETDQELADNEYWHSQIAPREKWFANGIDNACGGPAGKLAGLLSPEAARELADWLRGHAKFAADVVELHGHLTTIALANISHPLAFARLINTGSRT